MTTEQMLKQLVDEAAIRAIVDGISRTTDAKDWKACRAYFTEDIQVDFTSLAGGEPGPMKADALVFEMWSVNLFPEKTTHHMHTGHTVEISGDTATCFCKGYAWNKLERPLGDNLWEVWGNYTHTFRHDGDGWICTGITFEATHARGNEKVREYVPEK
jgi:hypothetical protein